MRRSAYGIIPCYLCLAWDRGETSRRFEFFESESPKKPPSFRRGHVGNEAMARLGFGLERHGNAHVDQLIDQLTLGGVHEAEQAGVLVIDAEVVAVVVEVADEHPASVGVAADLGGQRDFLGSSADRQGAVELVVLVLIEHEGRSGIFLHMEEVVAFEVTGELIAALPFQVGHVDGGHIDDRLKETSAYFQWLAAKQVKRPSTSQFD